MTIFISHAGADAEIAEELEKFLERRGQFVELDDGETALRPLQGGDVAVLLISQNLVMSLHRLRLEQRALDAWADNRLVLVKLDHAFAPVGLRDLAAVDASFEAQREDKWNEIAKQVQEKLRAPSRAEQAEREPIAPSQRPAAAPRAARSKAGGWGWVLGVLLVLAGLGALAVSASIWLVNRIGPTPGTLADLFAGIDAFGARYGAPQGLTPLLFAAAIALMAVVLVIGLVRAVSKPRRRPARASARMSNRPAQSADAVFVSYARANASLVLPVIDAAKRAGKRFWLDQQSIASGDGWAGEIVKAIRGAPNVLVMCSKAAFESDHVKREIYLADRYKKRLLPVFIEAAHPPEDFEYFFAGVQGLNLFETPEAERPAALMRVLEAA